MARPTEDYFRKWLTDLEGDHDEYEKEEAIRRSSPILEYIESYYISNPTTSLRKKIFDIGGLTMKEKIHIINHVEFILYGSVKVSTRTEIVLDKSGRLRKRYISTHRRMKLRLDPATKSMLSDLLKERRYSIG